MTATISPIVLAFDFTASANEALKRTASLVERMPVQALHVVAVMEPGAELRAAPHLEGDAERVHTAIAELLDRTIRPAIKQAHLHVYVHVRVGTPGTEILAVAREVGAGLIVVGSQRVHGRDRFAIGSVAEAVVHGARCSVEVVRANGYEPVADEVPKSVHRAHVYSYPTKA